MTKQQKLLFTVWYDENWVLSYWWHEKKIKTKSCDRSTNRGAKCNICLSPYLPIYVHVSGGGDRRFSESLFSVS